MRTLVVSDMHIGAAGGRSRLDDDATLERLAQAAAEADRLVRRGDVIEMRQGPIRDALADASRVLPRLVGGLGAGKEVVIVAGNHVHELFGAWVMPRGASGPPEPMALETPVDWQPGEPLAAVAEMLGSGGAGVRAAYPGLWLREDVYATHGHYLDPHTQAPGLERLMTAVINRHVGVKAADLHTPDDYERTLSPIYAWMLALSERGAPELDSVSQESGTVKWLRRLNSGGAPAAAAKTAVTVAAKGLQALGLGELSADIIGPGLARTENRGVGVALTQLGVRADHVIFGHTHRAGPLPGDVDMNWSTPGGIKLINSGCWVREGVAFMGLTDPVTSPYRPGFAVTLEDSGPPRLANLLEG